MPKSDAAIVMHQGSADAIIARLVKEGWILESRIDHIAGKRIRYLIPPDDWWPKSD